MSLEIVIARYKENLMWLELLESSEVLKTFDDVTILVYNKSQTLVKIPDTFKYKVKVIPIPNVGRESHTYLTHIVQNYNNLTNRTVLFIQGEIKDHCQWYDSKTPVQLIENLLKAAVKDGSSVEYAHILKGGCAASYAFRIGTHNNQPLVPRANQCFGDWFNKFVGEWNGEAWQTLPFWIGSLFALQSDIITRQPIEYYQKLLDQVAVSLNPETGHYMERAWLGIFKLVDTTELPKAYIRKEGKLL